MKTLTAERKTLFYPDVVAALEFTKPDDAPSRSECFFAADSMIGAEGFIQAQLVANYNIYEIDMEAAWKGPFCLVNEIGCRIATGAPFDALVKEYWEPTLPWRFYEYFGPKILVQQVVPHSSAMDLSCFRLSYRADVAQAKSIF